MITITTIIWQKRFRGSSTENDENNIRNNDNNNERKYNVANKDKNNSKV